MPTVDVVDETFLAVPREIIAPEFAHPARWPALWPDLRLEVTTDRGPAGVRWTVAGALVGSMEVWLEPVLDGTVLHYFLRADPAGADGLPAAWPARRAAAEVRRRQRAAKAIAFRLKDRLEHGRAPGEPPPAPAPPAPDRSTPPARSVPPVTQTAGD
ncbi:MAG: polyketide cyclase / dehydrase and lipid transport [Pseudonocardia sp.]|nr:polyketide cyclase / dehydrase and lipid transport [Pseudonocardia sp.]